MIDNQEKLFKRPSSIFQSRQLRVNLELRGNEFITQKVLSPTFLSWEQRVLERLRKALNSFIFESKIMVGGEEEVE